MRRTAIFITIIIVLASIANWFNHYVEPRLQAAASTEVNHAINNLVSSVLANIDYDSDSLIHLKTDSKGNVTSIDYDTLHLNQILYSSLDTISDSLEAASEGKEDPLLHQIFFKDGIIYEMPLGALTHLSFLNDVGPKIPIKMQVLNQVNGEIITYSEPYGINNTMIKIVLRVKIEAKVLTVLSVSSINVTTEVPLVIQVVNGDIPGYLPFSSQSTTK